MIEQSARRSDDRSGTHVCQLAAKKTIDKVEHTGEFADYGQIKSAYTLIDDEELYIGECSEQRSKFKRRKPVSASTFHDELFRNRLRVDSLLP